MSPREAIVEFTSCTTHLTGVYSRTGQVERVVGLLPNIARLAPLSPAVAVAADTVRFSANARRGWLASDLRLSVLIRVRAPVPELTETTRGGLLLLTLYYQGLEEAVMGDSLAFARADELEAVAPYSALGWQLRTVAHLFQGQEKTSQGGTAFFDERFGVVALVSDEGDAPVVPGIVLIDCEGAASRLVPDYVLRECANALLDAGDVPRQ